MRFGVDVDKLHDVWYSVRNDFITITRLCDKLKKETEWEVQNGQPHVGYANGWGWEGAKDFLEQAIPMFEALKKTIKAAQVIEKGAKKRIEEYKKTGR